MRVVALILRRIRNHHFRRQQQAGYRRGIPRARPTTPAAGQNDRLRFNRIDCSRDPELNSYL
jgi:hypothetical protein